MTNSAVERKYFGTDGIRGVANKAPLDSETLVRLGRAIAKVFLNADRKHRILIGKDTRLSGYMIESSLAAGITSMGVDVLLVGPVPTPGVAYLTRSMRADAGIMISASHNPFEDNGIKIFAADGYKLPDDLESQLEFLMEPGKLESETAAPGNIGKATRINDAIGRYTVYLKSHFPRALTLEKLKVGFDGANGAAYVVGPQTFQELGAEVVARGISPNGRNINAGFGSLYPEIVRELVLENNLDIGVAVDGDGDRVILVDEKGNVVDGDMMLAIIAKHFKEVGMLKVSKVVSTVMANFGLERVLKDSGIDVLRTKVGDRYVLEEMLKEGVQLGGEQSGHIICSEYGTTGDGILSALMVLKAMCETGKPLSELNASFKAFPQEVVSIPVAQKIPFEENEAVHKAIQDAETKLGDVGRVLVRYSGTENKARVMVECESSEECKKIAQELARVIENELGVT